MQPTMVMVQPNPDQLISGNVLFNVDVIETTYDHLFPINTEFSAKHNREENVAWTDSEQEKAMLGTSAQSVSDLWTLVHVLIFRVTYC